jgi:predicted Fe-S protein YdhL (DUF1289 family)
MEVKSPCIDVCALDRNEVCIGCGRHIDEVVAWGTAPSETKLRIVEAARRRLAAMQAQTQQQQAGPR